MRIAIDARGINWYKGTGIGTYTKNLVLNMLEEDKENSYYFYWSGDDWESYLKDNTNVVMTSNRHHRFFEDYYFPHNISKNNIDIYHIPQNGISLNKSIDCKKVITIHDLIPYIMPETVGRGYLLKFLRDVPQVIENSSAIITVSNWSKKDILKFFPIDENRVFVTHLAVDKIYKPMDKEKCMEFLKQNYNIQKPFILYIGGFSPRKNVRLLIEAFSKIYNSLDRNYCLVIVGEGKDEGKLLNSMSKELKISSDIIFTGFVPEKDLPIFYNACTTFAYPSLYEGFGLPPLEAMSCGTAVVTSNVSSIPEIVGNSAILINPYSLEELCSALGKVLSSSKTREELCTNGIKTAQTYSWKNTAIETLKVYKKIYEQD